MNPNGDSNFLVSAPNATTIVISLVNQLAGSTLPISVIPTGLAYRRHARRPQSDGDQQPACVHDAAHSADAALHGQPGVHPAVRRGQWRSEHGRLRHLYAGQWGFGVHQLPGAERSVGRGDPASRSCRHRQAGGLERGRHGGHGRLESDGRRPCWYPMRAPRLPPPDQHERHPERCLRNHPDYRQRGQRHRRLPGRREQSDRPLVGNRRPSCSRTVRLPTRTSSARSRAPAGSSSPATTRFLSLSPRSRRLRRQPKWAMW